MMVHIILVVLSVVLGYQLHKHEAGPPHEGIWIEFANLQHAIDSASKLGGSARGFVVCVQKTEKTPYPIWNPGVSLTGDLKECAFRARTQQEAMIVVSPHAQEVTFSYLYIDSKGQTIGSVVRNNRISN